MGGCAFLHPIVFMEPKMKKLTYALALCGVASMSTSALADGNSLSGNIGIASDYLFRGISQSQHKPQISGGIDYAHASGLYVGTWLSNQAWVNAGGSETNSSLEMDLYGGYRGSLPADFGYDVGVIHYHYPGNRVDGYVSPNTTEAYVAGSWKFLSLKYSYTVSDYFVGWTGATTSDKTRGSNYIELNANYDLGSGWGVLGHVGHQKVKHDGDNHASYTDWKVGVSKDVGFGTVSLAYSDTDANKTAYTWDSTNPKDVSRGVAVLSWSKSF